MILKGYETSYLAQINLLISSNIIIFKNMFRLIKIQTREILTFFCKARLYHSLVFVQDSIF